MNAPVAADLSGAPPAFGAGRRTRVCFLYIAQAHQVPHSLSVAVELARSRPDIAVEVAATSRSVLGYARMLADQLGPAAIGWRLLGPAALRALHGSDGVPPKLPMLAANAPVLARYDVIVAPERTTAMLRAFGVRARLVYTQHGAGDRGGVFEARLADFDLVFSAGPKMRDRMVSEGLVAADHCAVVGYPKFDLVDQLAAPAPKLFETTRPTVLYNPHFLRRLSSWPLWGRRVLEAFAGQDRYNLIFAPHLRLFGGRSPARVPELRPFLDLPGLHIDLGGSAAAIDMTYTRMADVYVGDASSQVYEFLRTPRPCLFLNPQGTDWRGQESYRHWSYGPVLDRADDVIAAIDMARATHTRYVAVQRAGFALTFGEVERASRRGAEAIAGLCAAGPRGTAHMA